MESHSISRNLVFVLSMYSMLFMGALTKLRAQMTNKNQSVFEINENGALMFGAIVALFSVEITSGLLFFTNIPSKYYAILKRIGIFSATVAPFLTLMALDDFSPKDGSMLYLLGLVFYGFSIAFGSSSKDDLDNSLNKISPIAVSTYLGLVLVPLSLVMVLFVPKSLDGVVYAVIYPIFGMEIMCFLIVYINFMFMIVYEKPKAQDLEAHQGIIHQDKNISDLKAQLVVLQDKKQTP